MVTILVSSKKAKKKKSETGDEWQGKSSTCQAQTADV